MTARTAAVPHGRLVMIAALAFATLAMTFAQTPAHAEDGSEVTWSVQPSSPDGPDGRTEFDYHVAPGTTISDWVSVSNFSAQPATFRVHGADATTDYDTGAFTLVGADEASVDAGAWTSIDSGAAVCADTDDEAEAACAQAIGTEITLQPGSRADLPFTITVPQDATPGDHAAGIVASFRSTAVDGTGSAVNVSQRVGTRIYLRIDGPLNPVLDIRGTVSGYDGSWNPIGGGIARVGFDLANSGNVRLSATPSARLTGPFGIDLGTVTLPSIKNLVPGGTTHVTAEFAGVPPLILLFADLTVVPAAAEGAASADVAPAPIGASTVAWAIPWSLLGVLAVIAGAIWASVWWRRRAQRRLTADLVEYTEQVLALARSTQIHPTNESEPMR
ncbi:hypothetical protein DCE93_06890 [Agromyces badenianii]|uniref:DUF916 domain-containing protein n=1 Tax=Agromyces badenianii TaxID=2080742 RepID=A0A2S0WVQ1_9MICO|nr:DUF916 domain-containing protein [Agromyces badenianii]AWB95417.1 hypothetical protein DCE93_06890 [Agromyces badenianii]